MMKAETGHHASGAAQIDLRLLEIFGKIYECGSVSRAADALGLTQPTISNHLKNLEDSLETRLFDRLGREIVPTAAGEHLYRYARDIAKLKEEARLTLDQLNGKLCGTLDVGASSVPGEFLLPSFMKSFRQMHGGVMFRLRVGDSHDVVNMVAERVTEVGIIGAKTTNSSIECRPLCEDELVLVAHPSFGPNRIDLEDIRKLPFVFRERGSGTRAAIEEAIEQASLNVGSLNIVAEVGSTASVKRAVMAELGLSVISSLAVKDELAAGTLKKVAISGISMTRNLYVITHRLREKSLLCQAFCDMLFAGKKGTNPA